MRQAANLTTKTVRRYIMRIFQRRSSIQGNKPQLWDMVHLITQWHLMQTITTLRYFNTTQHAMAHGATYYQAMELSSSQHAMAHGAPFYFSAIRLDPNYLSKATTSQASSNAYYFTQHGTRPSQSCVNVRFHQDTNMCMPDHQLVSVAYDDTYQDVIMQNKASTTALCHNTLIYHVLELMQFHCLQQCIKTNRFRFHVVRL